MSLVCPCPREVGGDDLASRGQAREQLAELQVDVEQPTVQQKQRCPARTVELVVHAQSVDRGVPGLRCGQWLGGVYGHSDS